MIHMPLVFTTFDVDCDGWSRAAHRVMVPASRVMEFLGDHAAFRDFMRNSDQSYSRYIGEMDGLMSNSEFMRTIWPTLDDFHRGYWLEVGYSGLDSNLRDCTAEYETTADLNEAHWLAGIEADIEMADMIAMPDEYANQLPMPGDRW